MQSAQDDYDFWRAASPAQISDLPCFCINGARRSVCLGTKVAVRAYSVSTLETFAYLKLLDKSCDQSLLS